MSKGNKEEQKWLLGESLNQYDRSLKEELGKVEKRNREQNHKISALINAFDDDYIKKEEENTNISLDYSKEGIVIVDDIKGNTLVNNVKDSNKELVLNGDIDAQGVNVTLEDTVDNGKVDVVLEGNTEVNLSKTKDPIMITHKFDDINSNNGKLQTTVNGVTTINDSPGKVDVKEITGDTLVNHVSNGSEELTLNGDIETNGYSNVTLTEGIDGGKVDVSLEGNTMVNVCDQEDPIAITKSYTVETGNHVALQGEYDGKCRPNIYGNTLVNLCKTGGEVSNSAVTASIYSKMTYFKAGTDYTIIYYIKSSNNFTVPSNSYLGMFRIECGLSDGTMNVPYGFTGDLTTKYQKVIAKFTTPSSNLSIRSISIILRNAYTDSSFGLDANTLTVKDVVILEGDYTNKPIPNYFTGMKSSFEDKLVPENLYKFSSRDDFYSLDGGTTLDGEYIKMTANSKYQNAMIKPLSTIKPSTTYTIAVDVVENTLNSMLFITNGSTDAQLPIKSRFQIDSGKTGIFTQVVTTSNDLNGCVRCLVNYLDSTNTTGNIKYRIMVVEGDYTNYDFTDYDSTKGGKYKVDYKVTGKNKCPRCTTTSASHNGITLTYDATTQTFSYSGTATDTSSYLSLKCPNFKLLKDKLYLFSVDNPLNDFYLQITEFNVGYNCNLRPNTTATPIINLDKYTPNAIMLYSQNLTIGQSYSGTFKVQIEEGTTATTYEPYKESIKTLYLNSPLLKGDTIEQSGNNIIHNHRYGSVVLDGSNYVPSSEQTLSSVGNYRWKFYISDVKNSTSTTGLGICDKYPIVSPTETWNSIEGITQNNDGNKIVLYLDKYKDGSDTSKQSLINELSTSPITFVYKKSTPTQEIISSNDNLLLDSYTNGHLDVNTVVPIDKVAFNDWSYTPKYLSPSTEYIIQFESDNVGKLYYTYTNGAYSNENSNIVKGLNKFTLTTPSEVLYNNMVMCGIGFNMSKIVVTPKVDNDFGYFKGMKSVGECEGNKIEILSQNKNLLPILNLEVDNEGYANRQKTYWQNVKLKPNTKYTLSYINKTINNTNSDMWAVWVREQVGKKAVTTDNIVASTQTEISTSFTTSDKDLYEVSIISNNGDDVGSYLFKPNTVILEEGEKTSYVPYAMNKKEILLNEPLRGLPNGVCDKYVIIDGKWYIERNCGKVTFNGSEGWYFKTIEPSGKRSYTIDNSMINGTNDYKHQGICDKIPFVYWNNSPWDSNYNCISTINKKVVIYTDFVTVSEFNSWLQNNPITVIYQLQTPTYEPIDYNPFEVYTDITHISNNSTIPCNMVIKNSGYNTISLKENTKYTAYVNNKNNVSLTYKIDNNAIAVNSSNKFTFTTPSTLVDKTIRIASKGNKIENLMIIEGTPQNDPIGYFDSLKSSYECEKVTDVNNENFGKYKVDARVKGENFESTQTVYLNSPLLKGDKIIWKDNKLQHYHKMKTVVFDGSDDEDWVYWKDNTDNGNLDSSLISFYLSFTNYISSDDKILIINDRFIPSNTVWASNTEKIALNDNKIISFQIACLRSKLSTQDVTGFKQWLQQNPITVVYELATPYYEEISEYPLKFSSIANCSLSTTSNIQVSNISFNIYEETLPYLYNDKKYYITFNSDISKEIIINLGGSESTYTTKVGFNKVEITTPSNSNNMLTFNGQGVNINNVKVTQQNIDSYFEGMKSVGECEDLEIVSFNKNLYNFDWTILATKNDYGTSNGYFGTIQKLRPNTKYYITIKNNNNINFGNYYVYTQGSSKGFIWVVNSGQNVQGNNSGAILTDDTGFVFFRTSNNTNDVLNKLNQLTFQIEEGTEATTYTVPKLNKQTLTHEPLRGLPNGVKDKYVIIDGKWYIERNCEQVNMYELNFAGDTNDTMKVLLLYNSKPIAISNIFSNSKNYSTTKRQMFVQERGGGLTYLWIPTDTMSNEEFKRFLNKENAIIIFAKSEPTYEPIDYNPFEVYTDTTHISNNSLIPCNMVIKNTGYNCILKPNTKYTVVTNTQGSISAKVGSTKVDYTSNVFTIITPSTLTDSVLRFSGKGLTTKDIMLLEGDKTNYIPKYFTGMESAFEQEYDEEKNKYKVNVKVTDGNKENNITFYINEPLRGVGNVKDKVYVKEDKIVVERNCSSVILDGSEDEDWGNGGYSNSKRIELYGYKISDMTGSYYSNVFPCYRNGFQDIKSPYGININPNNYVSIFIARPSNIPNNVSSNIEYGRQWLQQNPTTVVYQLATPTYEEVECDLSKLMLENYENSSLILNSNIPPTVDVRYKGEVPIVSATKELSSNVESTTTDINENIIPYMCDMDYRIVELQLKNASTQGLEVNVLGLDSEDVLFNNRKANKIFNPSYEMLKRDILSKRYSTDEYKYRLERYLLANKISNEEYNELEELINGR